MAVSVATAPPTLAEEDEFFVQVLRLRDAVLAGKHAHFKLPASAIKLLTSQQNGIPSVNTPALIADNHVQQQQQQQQQPSESFATALKTSTANGLSEPRTFSSGLDPIFLQKSPSLVRAEGVMKRQRIERELELQVEQRRRSARDKDHGHEGLFSDVNAILLSALERVKPVSGLKPVPQPPMTAASSFDENDYYSSHVHTDWSSDASSSKGSDREANASYADVSYYHDHTAQSSAATSLRPQYTTDLHHSTTAPEDIVQLDEDDEYTPPDATTFDTTNDGSNVMEAVQMSRQDYDLQHDDYNDDDDDDDYEPGEITYGATAHTSDIPAGEAAAPVIRNNHLTHIAAPQPNRVSPLATAKGPSIELELVNGRPEVVRRPQTNHRAPQPYSRASTGSPVGNSGNNGRHARKRGKQKRKRQSDHEIGRDTSARKRRERQVDARSPVTPIHSEPFIKPEPLSPPPLQQAHGAPAYLPQPVLRDSSAVDLVSPQILPPPAHIASHAPRSALRHEYTPQSPGLVRLASPAGLHSSKRNSQDLRRIASLHHAQRPSSPAPRTYTPVTPYRAVSHTYGQYQQTAPPSAATDVGEVSRYHDPHVPLSVQYVPAGGTRSPPRMQEYQDHYLPRAQSPALMLPPPPRKVIVDQYGQRYYAAEPVQVSEVPRASVAPVERRAPSEMTYDARAPSRTAYGQPSQIMQHELTNGRTVLLPPLARPPLGQAVEYNDPSGHRYREYSSRPVESVHHTQPSTSPVYQQISRYEPMAPPQAPLAREQTSPVYAPPRGYSVRPEESQQLQQHQVLSNYLRQASVAPVQYIRHEAPQPPAARAMSVIPNAEYSAAPNIYSYPPPPVPQVKYVDQYGRPIYPSGARQPSEYQYQ